MSAVVDTKQRDEMVATLQASLYPGADYRSVEMVLAYCEAAQLDPLTKPVHIVPMWDSASKKMRDVVLPGIELYRTKAARTGQYLGITKIEYGPEVELTFGSGSDKVVVNVWEWIEVTVSRLVGGNHVASFPSGRIFWKECYATARKDTDIPNAMWRKRARGQHEKCAEALALRRGFPEVGAQPVAEEMIGRDLHDIDLAPVPTQTVDQPKALANDPSPTLPQTIEGEAEVVPAGRQQHEQPAVDTQAPPDTTPASPGMRRIVEAKMRNAGITPEQLAEKWGYGLDEMPACDVNAVLKWIGQES